jgi:alkanesulfonate monooxygenase SsuD/methylene tetrahydromethanopterin reductase-like flavin-dependent oxidoreductase (luciferase family)
MIESWGFYLFPGKANDSGSSLSAAEAQEAYDRYTQLWISCEDFGFDGLAFAEHHFRPVNLSPSTHLLVAFLAARTRKLRFTTLGSVLALHDARRYVEEIGMLDYLTRGRFEPGIAPGAGDIEAVTAGIPAAEIRPRYYSGAEVLAKALHGPLVTHHDAFYDLEQVPIIPPMREGEGRPVWVTVMSPDSAAWAAERGFKMCTAWLPSPGADALGARYREAAGAAGRPAAPAMLGLRRRVFVAGSDAEAHEKYEAATDYVVGMLGLGFETADSQIRKMMMHPDDFAIGSPETVTEKLVEQCRSGGYGSVMHFTDFAGFSPEDLTRSHELIGRQVAPVLRSADLGSAAGHAATRS